MVTAQQLASYCSKRHLDWCHLWCHLVSRGTPRHAACSDPECAYRLVIVKLLCPNRSAISSSGAPFIRKRLASVCLKSCQRKFLICASVTASSNQCRPFSSGSPVFAGWNTRPLTSPRPCTPSGRQPQHHLAGRV